MIRPFLSSNFNPRSSCEERLLVCISALLNSNFNPRSSCEERLTQQRISARLKTFQSTLLMRGATRQIRSRQGFLVISIHAPHARSDRMASLLKITREDFNPRSSCEERRARIRLAGHPRHFNPRSSCEERLARSKGYICCCIISIHAPHARSDDGSYVVHGSNGMISIHAPHARSDAGCAARRCASAISIHAPHARSDHRLRLRGRTPRTISIHAPHARSDVHYMMLEANYSIFQSTLLMRGATWDGH